MRNIFKLAMVAVVLITISACSHIQESYNQKHFIKYANSVPPMVAPAGVKTIKEQTYYKLPKRSISTNVAPVSLVPPGSQVLQKMMNPKKKLHMSQRIHSKIALSKTGAKQLVLGVNAQTAWEKVGKVLRQSHVYQILDKDSAMHSYYILDTKVTHNKVTQSTPIYRLYIHADGKHSEVGLVDRKNKPISPKIAQRILAVVKQNLS